MAQWRLLANRDLRGYLLVFVSWRCTSKVVQCTNVSPEGRRQMSQIHHHFLLVVWHETCCLTSLSLLLSQSILSCRWTYFPILRALGKCQLWLQCDSFQLQYWLAPQSLELSPDMLACSSVSNSCWYSILVVPSSNHFQHIEWPRNHLGFCENRFLGPRDYDQEELDRAL